MSLRGITGDAKGKVWESGSLLRAGRLGTLEIVLDDSSVSRRHAELRIVNDGWWVRDLDSTNGAYVNGERLPVDAPRQLHSRDILQFGKVAMMVEIPDSTEIEAGAWHNPPLEDEIAIYSRLSNLLNETKSLAELIQPILKTAVSLVKAHCGGIALVNTHRGFLPCQTFIADARFTHFFDFRLAFRCVKRGESILYEPMLNDPPEYAIHNWQSTTWLALLMRTQGKPLGVLSLMRHGAPGFDDADLRRADAFAAQVSAGVEQAAFGTVCLRASTGSETLS